MWLLSNQAGKSYYAMLAAVFYISLQAFLALTPDGPIAPDIKDVNNIYVVQTMKSVNDGASVSSKTAFFQFLSLFRCGVQPKPIALAFCEGMNIYLHRPCAWQAWNVAVGAEQESKSSSDMVFRK